jgi:hypothetical protein
MKRLVYVVIGAALAAAVAFVAGSLATNWYSDHLAKSDDDINFVVKLFLILWPLFVAAGGLLGLRLHKKDLSLRSSGKPPVGGA